MKRELRPFLAETFSDASVDQSGMFSRSEVQAQWRGFLAGTDARQWSRIWSLGVLIAFANRRIPLTAALRSAPSVTLRESAARPSLERPPACRPTAPVSSRSLLMAPEIFSSEGGIARILQTYLKALGEFGGPSHAVRLIALNDRTIHPADLQPYAPQGIDGWSACAGSKIRFVREAIRLSRGCDRLICGHVAQLPVAWLAARLNPGLRYYLVAHGIEVWRPFNAAERIALRGAEKIFCVSDYTRRELLRCCPLQGAGDRAAQCARPGV
jgi:hypothetical protein